MRFAIPLAKPLTFKRSQKEAAMGRSVPGFQAIQKIATINAGSGVYPG